MHYNYIKQILNICFQVSKKYILKLLSAEGWMALMIHSFTYRMLIKKIPNEKD